MTMSPAARAIGIAALVVVAALTLYAVAATLDRWPELVIAAWGAALGAGMAINGIALREMDFADDATSGVTVTDRIGTLLHQTCVVFVAITAWRTAVDEHMGWAAATIVCGIAWAWTLYRIVGVVERADRRSALRAYFRAFQVVAVLLAVCAIYASIALESPWLWRPTVPADLQWLVWLAILEFASLPITFLVLRS
jgi:hypothetical protein